MATVTSHNRREIREVMPSALWTLSAWASEARDFGQIAYRRTHAALVDVTACMIAGIGDPAVTAVTSATSDFGTGPVFTFGLPKRLPAPWAALVNGTAAHALDFDDNFAPAFTHATAVLAPALLAVAEIRGATTGDLRDAFIVGLELQGRIGRLMQPAHYRKGWHATSTIGAIGTAGACARLMGGNAEQILAAMSITTSMAGGSKIQFGSMMKPIHAGLAAKNAVLGAQFAMAGVSAHDEPLDGDWGFAALTGARSVSAEVMLEDLGATLEIEKRGLHAKRFPCCGAVHRSLDGLEILRSMPGLALDQIDRIETSMPEMARRNLRFDCPLDEMEARFSGTYCMARMLLEGSLELRHFDLDAVRQQHIAAWYPRISLTAYDNALMVDGSDFESTTRIHLKDGQVLEVTINHPKGSPLNPLGGDDVFTKFQTCCAWSGHADAADSLFALVGNTEAELDIRTMLVGIGNCLTPN